MCIYFFIFHTASTDDTLRNLAKVWMIKDKFIIIRTVKFCLWVECRHSFPLQLRVTFACFQFGWPQIRSRPNCLSSFLGFSADFPRPSGAPSVPAEEQPAPLLAASPFGVNVYNFGFVSLDVLLGRKGFIFSFW